MRQILDDIFVPNCGFFEILFIEIYHNKLTATRNEKSIRDVKYFDVNLLFRDNDKINSNIHNKTEFSFKVA